MNFKSYAYCLLFVFLILLLHACLVIAAPSPGLDVEITSASLNASTTLNMTSDDLYAHVNGTVTTGNVTYTGDWYRNGTPFIAEDWNWTYNNTQDIAKGVALDGEGNIYIVIDTSNTDSDARVVKFNSSGEELWNYTFDLGNNEDPYGIAVDSNGDAYVVSDAADSFDAVLFKVNSSGSLQWNVTYTGSGIDSSGGITIDSNDDVYFAIHYFSGGDKSDILLLKYNASGDQLWNSTFSNGLYVGPKAITADLNANVYVTGEINEGYQDANLTLVKFNSSGSVVWNVTYDAGTGDDESGNAIVTDSLGNIYIAGDIDLGSPNDYLLLKYNATGDFLWNRTIDINASTVEIAYGIALDDAGNVYMTGLGNYTSYRGSIFTVKFNATGTQIWNNSIHYSPYEYDRSYGIAVDSIGGIYIAATVSPNIYSGGQYNATLIKLKDGFVLSNQTTDTQVLGDTLDSTHTSPGEIWKFCVQGVNNTFVVSALLCSSNLTIFNPSLDSVVLNNTNASNTSEGNLSAYVAWPFEDETNVNYTWQWLRNTTLYPKLSWNLTYTGEANDLGVGVVTDNESNVYVAGSTEVSDSYDMLLLKYNFSGELEWNTTFDSGGSDSSYALATDNNGSFYIAGSSVSGSLTTTRILRYNASGDLQWNVSYQNGYNNSGNGIGADSEGNVYVPVTTYNGTGYNITLVKYNISGDLQWNSSFSNGTDDVAYAVATDSAGNSYVTGYTTNGSSYYSLILKYNSTGSLIWNVTSSMQSIPRAIVLDAQNNSFIAGSPIGTSDYLVIAFNATGSELWNTTTDNGGTELAKAITLDDYGNIYVTGSSYPGVTDDIFTVKYNGTGTQVWNTTYDVYNDVAQGIVVGTNDSIYIAGYSNPNSDANLVLLQYKDTFRQTTNESGSVILLDTLNSLFILPDDIWQFCVNGTDPALRNSTHECSDNITIAAQESDDEDDSNNNNGGGGGSGHSANISPKTNTTFLNQTVNVTPESKEPEPKPQPATIGSDERSQQIQPKEQEQIVKENNNGSVVVTIALAIGLLIILSGFIYFKGDWVSKRVKKILKR